MTALDDIAAERRRQIEQEGWTIEHDDEHDGGEMARAAASYAVASMCSREGDITEHTIMKLWPWAWRWYKPYSNRRNLVRAGALIVAEIERLDRITQQLKETS